MQTIKQAITAAAGYQAAIGGRTIIVQSCDQGNVLAVTLTDSFGRQYNVAGVGPGFKAAPASGFNSVSIMPAVDCTVAFIVTDGDIDIQETNLSAQITNSAANPVPVSIVSEPGAPFPVSIPGTVTVTGATLTATNVGINNTTANPVPVMLHASDDATAIPVSGTVTVGNGTGAPVPVQTVQAGTITDVAPVAVANAGAVLLAAGTRRRVVIRNAGPGQLAITAAAATTFANAALVLAVGDAWHENDAAGAAFYAVSDTNTTANIQVAA